MTRARTGASRRRGELHAAYDGRRHEDDAPQAVGASQVSGRGSGDLGPNAGDRRQRHDTGRGGHHRQAACAHGLALALPERVELARLTGVGRVLATYEIPVEGRDEWLAAARRLA
jgi:hypothetical protein